MPERDWGKDMELCQRAKELVRKYGGWIPLDELEDELGFVSYAFEGWPAALEERARLEKWVKELEQRLSDLEDHYSDALLELRTIEYLRAENRRLRAVAEAASSYLQNCVSNECSDEGMYDLCETTCPLEDLREALAAPEKVQNHEVENRK